MHQWSETIVPTVRPVHAIARRPRAAAARHVAATGSVVALGLVLLVAGAAIAPTYARIYAMVDRAAPAGTATEAFAWLATAVAIGAAAGAAVAGAAAEQAGPAAAFALAGGAGAVALLAITLRAGTLGGDEPRALALAPA